MPVNYTSSELFPMNIALAWQGLTREPRVPLLPMTKGKMIRMRQLMYMYRKKLVEEGKVEGVRLQAYSLSLSAVVDPGIRTTGLWTIVCEQDVEGQALTRHLIAQGVKLPEMKRIEDIPHLNQARDTTMETEKVMNRILGRTPSALADSLISSPDSARDGGTRETGQFSIASAMEAKRQVEAGELDEVLRGMNEEPADPLLAKRWHSLRGTDSSGVG